MKTGNYLLNVKNILVLAFLFFLICLAPREVQAGTKVTLKDGIYTISPYKSQAVVMEPAGGKSANGTNIQLGKANNAKYQQFSVTSLGGGRYKIQNRASGKVLDVKGGSKKSGANIQLYAWNGTAAQIFTINAAEENGKTVCELVGAGSGLAVDYAGASTKVGTNVRLYTRNYTSGQKWIFTPVQTKPAGIDAGIKAGFYKIYSSKSGSLSVGIPSGLAAKGLSAAMCGADTDDGTIFKIVPTSGGRYRITVASSGLSFSINGTSAKSGTAIVQRASSGKSYDEWYIRKENADSDLYIFVCVSDVSIVMDLSGGKAQEGQAVRCYSSNGTAAQKWKLKAAYDPNNTHILPDGIYSISYDRNRSRVMEVAGGSLVKSANVALGTKNHFALKQLFRVKASGTSGNLYTITNVWSEMALDVAGNKTVNGTNLQQYSRNGSTAQLFRIVRVKNGADPVYKIIGKESGKAVEVAGARTAAGSNIQIYDYNATGAQLWHFYELTAQDRADALVPKEKNSTAIARNTMLLQEAVDLTSAAGGGTLHLPAGTFYFGSAGYVDKADVAITCRDNVTLAGAGMDATILKPYGSFRNGLNMFFHGGSEYVTNMDFRDFTIDAGEEKAISYNNQGKGFMMSPLRDCDWENVKVRNTDGTGFGVDLPVNCVMRNCVAENCGKAGSRTGNGSSGFGIGIGLSEDESMLIENCRASDNKKYGYFFENQVVFSGSNEKCRASKAAGFVVKNCVAGNNLYDFGGVRAHDVTYENCRSLAVSSADLASVSKGFDFRNHSRRITVTGCSVEEPISDVTDSSAEYYEPVHWAYNGGIVERPSSGGAVVFEPDQYLTREGAAEYLYRLAGRPGDVIQFTTADALKKLPCSFTDVAASADCYDAVEWLKQQGLADIFTETDLFGPGTACTRGQYLNLLYRRAGSPEVADEETGDENGDIELPEIIASTGNCQAVAAPEGENSVSGNSVSGNSVSDNSVQDDPSDESSGRKDDETPEVIVPARTPAVYVRWASANGIIGEDAAAFNEELSVTRGEAITWLYRYNNLEG